MMNRLANDTDNWLVMNESAYSQQVLTEESKKRGQISAKLLNASSFKFVTKLVETLLRQGRNREA